MNRFDKITENYILEMNKIREQMPTVCIMIYDIDEKAFYTLQIKKAIEGLKSFAINLVSEKLSRDEAISQFLNDIKVSQLEKKLCLEKNLINIKVLPKNFNVIWNVLKQNIISSPR